ncbi:MAG: O-antigen ligase family protein [Clostridium sp.]|nr:O-antigen ligase family protein [Clostridium sp.]
MRTKIIRRTAFFLAFTCLCAASAYESILGLRQVFGRAQSGHSLFAMTGSFGNPGPYGGFIAMTTAVSAAYIIMHRRSFSTMGHWVQSLFSCHAGAMLTPRHLHWILLRAFPMALATTASILGLTVLPASMSRAAWLSFAVAMLVLGFAELDLKSLIKKNRLATAAACLVAVFLMAGAFFMKKDSAIGRLHIWHIELLAMRDNPWRGTGAGTVLGTYGRTQAAYFEAQQRSAAITMAAGCPEYAFNEYFRIGVEHGVPAMLAAAAILAVVIAILLRARSPFAYGLVAFAVFSFFSYPLSMFKRESAAEKDWHELRSLSSYGIYDDSVSEYRKLYGELHGNYRFLYDYGYALHKAGEYAESNDVLHEGSLLSSDPMFHNIMGKNYEALGEFCRAEEEYLLAHYMVPCRIYPLVLLMEMKAGLGRHEEAAEIGRRILDMPVNRKNRTMAGLVERARATLLSMEPLMLD